MPRPQLTILMAVYNGARYLREAVDSILTQTMSDFEFIIIDDGSTDATSDILASYRDARIRRVHQDNQGLASSLNRGLHLANTELVARMDADDIALPERLEIQLAEYERLGEPDVMGTAIEIISETGHSAGATYYPEDHDTIARNLIAGGPTFAHPTVLYKRDAVLSCGGYDLIYQAQEDYDLWLRMLPRSTFANSPQCLLKYRLRSSSLSRTPGNTLTRSPRYLHCLAKQRYLLASAGYEDLWNDEQVREQLLLELARRSERAGIDTIFSVGRALQVARVELHSPGLRGQGLRRLLQCVASSPIATLRYAISHRSPEPEYLTPKELLCM